MEYGNMKSRGRAVKIVELRYTRMIAGKVKEKKTKTM
jgi:hypothetical protein